MCGITGIFNYRSSESPDRDLLDRMTRLQAHRGPDDQGTVVLGPCGLGNRRLSIIDLSGGHMPLSNEDGSVWITFNGEIYNYRELRPPLEARGYRFRTQSDTEVILHHFIEHGPDSCNDWNGIFGAAIFDMKRKQLFLARDHFGVKPVYYYDSGQTLVFGSELKSILEHPDAPRELDLEALSVFVTLRYLPSPLTLLKGIRKLPPGHYLIANETGIKVRRYFDFVPVIDERLREKEVIDEYLRLLRQAVTRQMVADVPVGIMLSGGVDSAALAYFMSKSADSRIKSFSVGFRGSGDWNELDDARQTAEWVGTDHHPLLIEHDDYTELFPRSFWHLEEPISEPTISAYYHVCQLAASHLKVVLMGQGADEPLAGYDRYFGERYHAVAASLLRWTPISAVIKSLPRLEKLKMSVSSLSEKEPLERFIKICTVFQPEWQREMWRNGTFPVADGQKLVKDLFLPIQSRTTHLPPLAQFLYLDARTMLSDNLLLFGDKIGMANSLEVRVPFLDLDLIRFVESVPPSLKIHGLSRKYFHRKALSRILPAGIVNRKKRGFATPMDRWFRNELKGQIRAVLLHPDAAVGEVFRRETMARLIDLHVEGKENFRKHIYLLLSYEFWAQRFLRKREVRFADYTV